MRSLQHRRALVALAVVLLGSLAAVPDRQEVTLQTSAECYAVGDTVRFTLTNGLDSTIYFPCLPVWSIWDNTADTLVYPQIVLWVITGLGPDSSETYAWDQRDYGGSQVATGTYRVEVRYSRQMDPWNLVSVADTFQIGGPTPTESMSWGALKALWK
jgi:hypothetical protein